MLQFSPAVPVKGNERQGNMKSAILTWTTGTALFIVLAIPAQTIGQEERESKGERPPHYTVTDLGTLGGAYSYAFGINNAGEVAGGSATSSQSGGSAQTAFLWFRGQMRNLGTLGGQNSAASGVNSRGETAVVSETAAQDPNGEDVCTFGTHAQCAAAVWKNRKLNLLPNLLGGKNAVAININDLGQVVGYAENGVLDSSCLPGLTFQVTQFEPVLWEPNGRPRKLHLLPGDTVGFAFGINNKGETTGTSGLCSNTALPPQPNGSHAVLWERDGTPINLGDLGGAGFNIAGSINNRGEVTGTSQSSQDGTVHTFLWTRKEGMKDLGAFPGAFLTVAPCCNTINDRGEITGFAIDPNGNSRALVWIDEKPVDLNTLLPKNSPWYLQAAESINDDGQIVGYGSLNGDIHAFLATPCRDDE